MRRRRRKQARAGSSPVEPPHPIDRLAARLRDIVEQIENELGRADASAIGEVRTLRVQLANCLYVLTRTPFAGERVLSGRQKEVADLVLAGLPRKTIAVRLGISPRTVDTHMARLFAKMRVDSKIALAVRLARS